MAIARDTVLEFMTLSFLEKFCVKLWTHYKNEVVDTVGLLGAERKIGFPDAGAPGNTRTNVCFLQRLTTSANQNS